MVVDAISGCFGLFCYHGVTMGRGGFVNTTLARKRTYETKIQFKVKHNGHKKYS